MKMLFTRVISPVGEHNIDYWLRLGNIMKENKELGISNELYRDLVSRQATVTTGTFLSDLFTPSVL